MGHRPLIGPFSRLVRKDPKATSRRESKPNTMEALILPTRNAIATMRCCRTSYSRTIKVSLGQPRVTIPTITSHPICTRLASKSNFATNLFANDKPSQMRAVAIRCWGTKLIKCQAFQRRSSLNLTDSDPLGQRRQELQPPISRRSDFIMSLHVRHRLTHAPNRQAKKTLR